MSRGVEEPNVLVRRDCTSPARASTFAVRAITAASKGVSGVCDSGVSGVCGDMVILVQKGNESTN